ncbi:MAG: hypothetical protein ACO3MW_07240, partial [Rhodospirillales bacterium]
PLNVTSTVLETGSVVNLSVGIGLSHFHVRHVSGRWNILPKWNILTKIPLKVPDIIVPRRAMPVGA